MMMIRSMLMLVLLLVSTVATAATDCADWNTKVFAEAADRARWHACLAAGADPTARDEHGSTPLHRAAAYGHPSIVKALLDAGAKLDARTEEGKTPFDVISSKLKGTDVYWELHDGQYR